MEAEDAADVQRRLSLPFASSSRPDDGRKLRRGSLYPDIKNDPDSHSSTARPRRQSLVDSVPPLMPYSAAAARKDTDASVYTATTCAETMKSLSDSGSTTLAGRYCGSSYSGSACFATDSFQDLVIIVLCFYCFVCLMD